MGQKQSTPTTVWQLQPGDHIYCQRKGGLYDHHGIYVGDDMVIHLQGAAKKLGPPAPCEKCRDKRVINGEIAKVCIDCFLDGETIHVYDYGIGPAEFNFRKRGTCSLRNSKPPHEVIKTAVAFLEGSGFGPYDMFANNCEDFAVYCKTGTAVSNQIVGHIQLLSLAGPVGAFAGVAVGGAYALSKAITEGQRRP